MPHFSCLFTYFQVFMLKISHLCVKMIIRKGAASMKVTYSYSIELKHADKIFRDTVRVFKDAVSFVFVVVQTRKSYGDMLCIIIKNWHEK